ncbi:cobalamin-binding protein [Saccharomonospora piscinae]|uniref:Cobalamin-binding protein n=1 Tax=Saccharomonospora piscinae TaxID=687388 RepID=A0A1V9A788_SACPI|nr:cobalamin-dependent protein [Saccharomonospora piscinae]OQO92794.1 cobalamin-binding protein [Saccharomonospora piscinae]TLW92932.1 cobalamin-binding protein [Saccharomonospora piscinae]
MSTGPPRSDNVAVLDDFEYALLSGNTSAAVGVVDSALDDGHAPLSVLCEVITPAQRAIGQRWQDGQWSVAQEHIATGISLAATEAVARRVREVPATKGRVVVGCAEREWHALAAMVVGTSLRTRGWQVTFLGAATPAERLYSYLQQMAPDAVAVSTSVAGGLPSTRRAIEAATTAGIPVLAGGAAFGPDALRARALGATAWAPTLPEGLDLVEELPATVEPVEPLPVAVVSEQRGLDADHHRLVELVARHWKPAGLAPADDIVADTDLTLVARDCIEQPLRCLQGALLTGDGRLVSEVADWTAAVLRARSVPPSAVVDLRGELVAALGEYPLARRLVEDRWPGTAPA